MSRCCFTTEESTQSQVAEFHDPVGCYEHVSWLDIYGFIILENREDVIQYLGA